jgi:hypothetical protein
LSRQLPAYPDQCAADAGKTLCAEGGSMKFARSLLLPVFLIMATGCPRPDATQPTDPTVTGRYTATTEGHAFTLNLTESGTGAITGTGQIMGPNGSASLNVTGNRVAATGAVTMALAIAGTAHYNFQGVHTFNGQMAGTWTGPAFSGTSVVFVRQ